MQKAQHKTRYSKQIVTYIPKNEGISQYEGFVISGLNSFLLDTNIGRVVYFLVRYKHWILLN